MHILILASFYPSVIRPHTGIFIREQAEALKRAGQIVGVIVPPRIRETLHTWRQSPRLPPTTLEHHDDIPVYRIHYGWFPRVFPRVCAWLTTRYGLPAFQHYLSQHGRPDVIHAHNTFYGGYLAVQIQEQYQIPALLTEHSSNYLRGRIFLPGQHAIAKYSLHQMRRVFAVGHALADKLNTTYKPERAVGVMDNIVNTDFFVPAPVNTKKFAFAAFGGLERNKQFGNLIRAFARNFANNPDVRLSIGGPGGLYKQLTRLTRELGVAQQVRLLGRLSREEVRDLFQSSQVIVSSSSIETFGVTLIEGMACGKPVIATRSGGPDGFVNQENGLLIPVGSVDALAEAMQTLVQDYNRYDPAAIRDYCITRFSEAAIVRQLIEAYQALM